MKAIGNYILIEKVESTTKKVGGLIITEKLDSDNRYLKAKIISVGDKVQILKDGDTIYYDKHRETGVDYNDKIYTVIRDVDVVLVD
jgi:co-chaperonin GroES (HSP10)